MTWTSGGCFRTPEPDPPPDIPALVLMPYLARQYADLEPLRDESGDVDYPVDG